MIKIIGKALKLTLSKKSRPGDGSWANGVKGGGVLPPIGGGWWW